MFSDGKSENEMALFCKSYLSKIDAKMTDPLLISPTITIKRYMKVMISASIVDLSHMFVRFNPSRILEPHSFVVLVFLTSESLIVITSVLTLGNEEVLSSTTWIEFCSWQLLGVKLTSKLYYIFMRESSTKKPTWFVMDDVAEIET